MDRNSIPDELKYAEHWLSISMDDLAQLEQSHPELAQPSGFGKHLSVQGRSEDFTNAAGILSGMQVGQVPGLRTARSGRVHNELQDNEMAQPNVAATDYLPEQPTTFFGDDYPPEQEGVEQVMTRVKKSRKSVPLRRV